MTEKKRNILSPDEAIISVMVLRAVKLLKKGHDLSLVARLYSQLKNVDVIRFWHADYEEYKRGLSENWRLIGFA